MVSDIKLKRGGGESPICFSHLSRSIDRPFNLQGVPVLKRCISNPNSFKQSDRLKIYEEITEKLKQKGKIYPCYETPDELELKRKILLKTGKPPIYDRSALSLTLKEKKNFESSGRKPHWRLFIDNESREVAYKSTIVDPNRIFSRNGSYHALRKFKPGWAPGTLKKALDEIDNEREEFLNILMPAKGGLLISLHNNFRGYNIYKEKNKSQKISIKAM